MISLNQQTIIGNKNQIFKIRDDMTQKYTNGSLSQKTDDGADFIDTIDSSKRNHEKAGSVHK
ncbi:transfer domain protein [Streptococcus sanguinis]|nr:transfer domain protein [Streptococcus sanguinis]